MKLKSTAAFNRTLAELLDAYPLAEKCVSDHLDNLPAIYGRGDRCPGYGADLEVRKMRIPVAPYRFSSRSGLRLLVLVLREQEILVPLAIYKKGQFKKETDAVAWIKGKLRELLQELHTGR
ncbi:MAG: hypothetical protein LBU06_09585 [Desulfovibrio sp.]|nr:hypothetical protein [Desulfovibrio sp.]